ncbi:MAG: bifunctional 4-hydroxy-2-oxoglutarate aldolase/2-dehydro-3-deoxy-phosphogluconate aldolase [Fimbriimonadaceae bacterium]|jgi:2-dehydro-3-deoxyphosphogluconate aldolase/(4S)-4-hydroxy-2-oxoglutarate aldolase|nr:bifunctional 4-hydroxy-2-oxoglutarate aldolase/2-dehydro-3-deoxy-phosphogluconate aldolase [Fimbriimonadaceae bacterium]
MSAELSTLDQLGKLRLVAVIRAPGKASLHQTVKALVAGGIYGIEVTLTTPDAIEGIAELKSWVPPEVLLGVGTVLDGETAKVAIQAGASFVVSPVLEPEVIRATKDAGAVMMAGAFTPTEIFQAWRLGSDVVKVFPAASLGPDYFRGVLAPLPFLRLMPTGGVDQTNVGDWLSAGAFALGVGSQLASPRLMKEERWAEITELAKGFVQALP